MPVKTSKPSVRGRRTKAEEAARLREAEIRQSVDGVTVEGVVQKISGLGLEVSKALADISERLTREVQLLASTREAVALSHINQIAMEQAKNRPQG
jgi:hypothetical protein